MTKAIALTYTRAHDVAHEYRVHITSALLIVCGLLLMLYALNVYTVISHTVALQSIEKQTATLSAAVDSLDSQFLELSSRATPDNLKHYGFTTGQVSAYISRTTSLGTLATRDHEL